MRSDLEAMCHRSAPTALLVIGSALITSCALTDEAGPGARRALPTPASLSADACAGLASRFTFPGLRITGAALAPAGTFKQDAVVESSPAHCVVTGRVNERRSPVDGADYAIGFEMRLPLAWNGRFFHQVNGGIDGVVQPAIGDRKSVV